MHIWVHRSQMFFCLLIFHLARLLARGRTRSGVAVELRGTGADFILIVVLLIKIHTAGYSFTGRKVERRRGKGSVRHFLPANWFYQFAGTFIHSCVVSGLEWSFVISRTFHCLMTSVSVCSKHIHTPQQWQRCHCPSSNVIHTAARKAAGQTRCLSCLLWGFNPKLHLKETDNGKMYKAKKK